MTTVVDAATARAEMARLLLGPLLEPPLGTINLLPHQVDAAQRIRTALDQHQVALLADDVGMGKTYVALAVARTFAHVHIIAPAALLPMWRDALARTDMQRAHLVSLHRFSRAHWSAPVASAETLTIIDEAHHLRTPNTLRYRAVAESVADGSLLLLSATPIHNRSADVKALFD